MATITFTYADTYAADFRDALADYGGGYQATLPDGTPNPQTKAQFAKEVARKVLLQIYQNWKANQAKAAEVTAAQQAETNLNIT